MDMPSSTPYFTAEALLYHRRIVFPSAPNKLVSSRIETKAPLSYTQENGAILSVFEQQLLD
jgi:hypothetical protein